MSKGGGKLGVKENKFVTAEYKNYLWHAKLSAICDKKFVIEKFFALIFQQKQIHKDFHGWKLLQDMNILSTLKHIEQLYSLR